ncbi:hypothetical protein Q8A73_008167 [Channa argus]|nr:hypothetical protein Q8A73_008167 [Channa argus]
MASASGFLCEDQFLCSICLDVFMEPLSIPCGHNFCKSCITRHWEGKEKCQCPLCNSTFNKGLNLCINTAFREVVENFKKHRNSSFSEDGFCYEIQVNSNWDLGVVIESKRGKSTLLPIHGNGMGIIRLARNSNGKALQNDPVGFRDRSHRPPTIVSGV